MLSRVLTFVAVAALGLSPLPGRANGTCDWPMYGRDPGHSFAAPAACTTVGPEGAATMAPKWFFHARDSVSASPTVVDGTVYVGSWEGRFYALDAEDGHELWHFDIDDEHEVAFGRIVSSAAVDTLRTPSGGTKTAVLFGGGATLYALEHRSDRALLLAKVDVDPRTPELRAAWPSDDPPQVEIESSPVVGHFPDKDRIFVGMDVHNRGRVGRTGVLSFELMESEAGAAEPYRFELKYKFDPEATSVVSPNALTTGSGTGLGCGGVWSSPALQPTALGPGDGVIVFGTANCTSPAQSPVRESMWAIGAKEGTLLWRFQPPRPAGGDVDDDFGASANLLPAIGGRPVVGHGSKDGWYYARDLLTGAPVWSTRVGQHGRIADGFSIGGIIGTPAVGVANGRAAIFVTTAVPTPFDPFFPEPDPTLAEDPERLASVHALDAETGAIVWRSRVSLPSYGAPTYANGVVFVPDTFGLQLQALDANTGLLLRAQPLPGAPSSAPAIVGDSIYLGVGTRETDAEFKAFGNEIGDLFEELIGAHPLSPLSGVAAFEVID